MSDENGNSILTPADIEARADVMRISLTEVFKRAGVHHSIFYRWKEGKDIFLSSYARLLDATSEGRVP